ncbi:MAG: 2-oxoacid:acceptor oxidoreductase family protein [Candidatus Krumholzibacteriota bacterium]|nr:2-oxoacid:acceptor oxidoreductase family protein [Candidatus Krumholzibacteriota bacterium]
MSYKYCIRLSGSSNHGLKQAARILAEAAAIYGDKYALESASFGPEARSNIARADVIISDVPVDSPRVQAVDFLLVLTQEAFERHIADLAPGGVVVADIDVETAGSPGEERICKIPFFEVIDRYVDNYSMINIFVLGIFASISDVLEEKSIRLAIMARAPKLSEENYLSAFDAGIKTGSQYAAGDCG